MSHDVEKAEVMARAPICPRFSDIVIVYESTDIIKYYLKQVISALDSVHPKLKVDWFKLEYQELNRAKTLCGRSCKKMLFITDEACCPLSGKTFKKWTGALLDSKADVRNVLILNTKCDVQDLGKKLNVNNNCVVSIKDITGLDSWWPHVIKFAFKTKRLGDQGISVSVNNKHGENTNFTHLIDNCMNQFRIMKSEEKCQIIIDEDPSAASDYKREVQPQLYIFSVKDRHLEGIKSFDKMKTLYGQDETLTLVLHILTDFGAILARRNSFQQAVQNSVRTYSISCRNSFRYWQNPVLALLVLLLNTPVVFVFLVFAICPILSTFFSLVGYCVYVTKDAKNAVMYLAIGIVCICVSVASLSAGVIVSKQNSFSYQTNFSLVVLLCIIIPLYFIAWVLVCSLFLWIKKGFRFGIITLPLKIFNEMPFDFIQKACDSECLSPYIGLVTLIVFLLSLPFILIVIVILILSYLTAGWVFWITLFDKLTSPYYDEMCGLVVKTCTCLQMHLTLAVISVIIGSVTRQYLIFCLGLPCYFLLLIKPGDYLFQRYFDSEFGIFLWVIGLIEFVAE